MDIDAGAIVEGGGLFAFATVVYVMLRDHLRRVEAVLDRVATALSGVQSSLERVTTELEHATPPRIVSETPSTRRETQS